MNIVVQQYTFLLNKSLFLPDVYLIKQGLIMNFLPREISAYAAQHTTSETDVLYALNRETHLKVLTPQMLSGHLQGAFLRMISHMIRPKNILEVGTYTGYSAICLCAGLQEGGMLHTIDINEELAAMQQKYFEKSGLQHKITTHIGDALEIIPKISTKFDLAFIDADKMNYPTYYELIFDKIEKGGYLLADNVLWSGKVTKKLKEGDKATKGLLTFNQLVQQDERVENILLPIRDGIMIARKK